MTHSYTSKSLATFGYFGGSASGDVPPGPVTNVHATSRTTESILLTWRPATMTEYYEV
jgi:hypothetical protein